jgi:hypothetical protein
MVGTASADPNRHKPRRRRGFQFDAQIYYHVSTVKSEKTVPRV